MNKTIRNMGKAEIFWSWFKNNSSKYYHLNELADLNEKEKLLDEFLEQLHIYCNGLYFEIGGVSNEPQELVITAAGNKEFFNEVETLVDQAPRISDWNIIGFKPPMGANFITEYEGIRVDTSQIWFLPLDNENDPEALGLRIYFPNYTVRIEETLLDASYQMLDTILGEKSAALDLHHIEIDKLPQHPEKKGLIELSELPKYVSWKKSKV